MSEKKEKKKKENLRKKKEKNWVSNQILRFFVLVFIFVNKKFLTRNKMVVEKIFSRNSIENVQFLWKSQFASDFFAALCNQSNWQSSRSNWSNWGIPPLSLPFPSFFSLTFFLSLPYLRPNSCLISIIFVCFFGLLMFFCVTCNFNS